MPEPLKGVPNVDIRHSEPDWTPFEAPSPNTYNHYCTGWGLAFNTPFRRYEFNGGTCDPCIVPRPAGIKGEGETRDQYYHPIDLVWTILDVLGIDPPETIGGHVQSHFDGISMRSSFNDSAVPSGRPGG